MIRSAVRPSLSLNTAAAQNSSSRASLSLRSPAGSRTPISPVNPAAKRFSTLQVPNYAYANSCSSKSILKKHASAPGAREKRITFQGSPTVHCVTPIENPDEYYGKHVKMSRDERRWTARQ
ncbi:hypothetical protein N7462_000321 [Penicillium macrosclerotiorum]|uniref:uncharacterized protein n=1 Tax=Penicillium macrosclerotiorum TaxID=303699 RepID=UPI002548C707|nr:uncharacterized protein N7462_000321 [Penicillium macrosclerotiorum]KAJ5698316.1 hypothetical protein N7462_000321 [Penicillium macrosclerotiorum]